jgi:hypothetical protein
LQQQWASRPVFGLAIGYETSAKALFYALKSVTKVPNLIDFACWGADP